MFSLPEVDRKFEQKSFQKKLVKLQHQSRAELTKLLQWDARDQPQESGGDSKAI